jgi:glycosyltransferase involved in cell wall biosynthesis
MCRVVFVDRDFAHHGQFSGYKQIARYLHGHVLNSEAGLEWIPDRMLYRFPGMHPLWYNRRALELELRVLLQLAHQDKTIYHFLYGETSLRLAAGSNRMFGHRHRIIATYHQVPRFFEARRHQFNHIGDIDAAILVASNQRTFFEGILSSSQIHIIPHGVDTTFFEPTLETQRKSPSLMCLTVGSNYRDFQTHVQVIRHINSSAWRGINFVIVGDPGHARHFSDLEFVTYLSGISDKQLLECYHRADILFLPLADATACNALLEGMACGLPVVVSDMGGVRDYVNEECAALVPSRDVEAVVMTIIELVRNPAQRAQLGRAARDRAETQLDWRHISERVREVYRQVC